MLSISFAFYSLWSSNVDAAVECPRSLKWCNMTRFLSVSHYVDIHLHLYWGSTQLSWTSYHFFWSGLEQYKLSSSVFLFPVRGDLPALRPCLFMWHLLPQRHRMSVVPGQHLPENHTVYRLNSLPKTANQESWHARVEMKTSWSAQHCHCCFHITCQL